MEEKSRITVYSLPDCRYCGMLKKWLGIKGLDYEEVNVKARENLDTLRWVKANSPKNERNQTTFPKLFVDGEYVDHEPYSNILEALEQE